MSTRIINYASFITFLLIFTMQTNAQKSITGVVTEEISTKDGKFLLHRTTHLPKGKTISGTVMVEPESDKTKKREKLPFFKIFYACAVGPPKFIGS